MTVKIITDSSASIPPSVVEELGLTIIPSLIRFGDEVYRDGVDLTTEQFYERLTTDKTHPTTSVPTPQSFVDAYEKLAEEADEVAVITISHKLSAVGDVARQAMDLAKKRPRVEIIDTTWALMSEGLIGSAGLGAQDKPYSRPQGRGDLSRGSGALPFQGDRKPL